MPERISLSREGDAHAWYIAQDGPLHLALSDDNKPWRPAIRLPITVADALATAIPVLVAAMTTADPVR